MVTRMGRSWLACLAIVAVLGSCALAACTGPKNVTGSANPDLASLTGIHKIRHVIIIMQENRSFDNYFGTYPGADGIPMKNGVPSVCAPNPKGRCVRPFHDTADINGGGPHGLANAIADVNRGAMNGFLSQRDKAKTCANVADPACNGASGTNAPTKPDVMGYHTAAEVPNYWAYAKNFVLDDHMFEAVRSWSLPAHLYMVSGWSARCTSSAPSS